MMNFVRLTLRVNILSWKLYSLLPKSAYHACLGQHDHKVAPFIKAFFNYKDHNLASFYNVVYDRLDCSHRYRMTDRSSNELCSA